MTTNGISRGSQINGQFTQTKGGSGTDRPQVTQFVQRWVAPARKGLLPVCDAVGLTFVVVLLAIPGWVAAGYVVAVLVLLRVSGLHRLRICLRVSDEAPRMVAAAVLPTPLLLGWAGSAGNLALLGAASFGTLVAMRAGLYTTLRISYRRGWLTERALIIGAGELGLEIGKLLQEHAELGLQLIGFVDSLPPAQKCPLPLLGDVSEISDVVSRLNVGRIIVSPSADEGAVVSALRADEQLAAAVYVVPRMSELAPDVPTVYLDEIWGIPIIPLRRCGLRRAGHALKRCFDLTFGTLLLLAFGPLLLVLMAAVFLNCGRPVFFRQARVTRSRRMMRITKLRTVSGAEREGHWTVSPDECSTLSRWLRATHLDELPQLFNVIRGEMSLVGPRPERPYFTARFAEMVPRYEDRHRTSSGMTGWAQVHGLTGDTSIPERTRFDNNYIERWSPWLDIVILARTLAEPLTGLRGNQSNPRREDSSTEHEQSSSATRPTRT